MYRHFLVPVDETPLSTSNVNAAVDLARSLGAEITFFHATPDLSATGEGALMRTLDPETFAEVALGPTNAMLTKAIVSARAAEVRCKAVAKTCDHPAEAIIQAAASDGCDLIVMATRGEQRSFMSWIHNSQTERVLRRSPVALLVTRVGSGHPMSSAEQALTVIKDEHRSLAVVAVAMRQLVNSSQESLGDSDLTALQYMVTYLRDFPERVHHPKEELHLHRALRLRSPDAAQLLATVESQHVQEHQQVEELGICLADIRKHGMKDLPRLQGLVNALADCVLKHIGDEESHLLPLAQRCLTDADWSDVARAFAANADPRFGDLSSAELSRLFTQIANIAARTTASRDTAA